jgi:hypothetical protein
VGLISVSQSADGETAEAADINGPVNTIANEINGNLDNANIKTAAAIATSKLATDAGISTGMVADAAITPAKFTNPYKFAVHRGSAQNVGSAATKVQFETEEFDSNSNYDNATNYRYVAPVDGFYQINFSITTTSAGSGTNITVYLYKNGSSIWLQNVDANAGNSPGVTHSKVYQLTAADYLEVFVATSVAAKALDVSLISNNSFSGFLVSKT